MKRAAVTRKLALGSLAVAALLGARAKCDARLQTTKTVVADPQTDNGRSKESGEKDLIASETRSSSIDSFIQELTTLSGTLDDWEDKDHAPTKEELNKLRSSLPKKWLIGTDEGDFTISSDRLDHALEDGKIEDAWDWANHVRGEVQSYATQRASGDKNPRQELDNILGMQEFSGVRPPSAWDLFRQRASAWMGWMLEKLFAGMGRYPLLGKILFWTVFVLAVSIVARWVFNLLVNRDRMEGLTEQEIVAANRTWQEWFRMAKGAAARQDFREAVHSTYWAGIARLEDLAMLPKDRTKTPREYLQVISKVSQKELVARRVTYSDPLERLTMRLERAWYANRGTNARDFEDSVNQLKALGCQLD